MASIYGGGLPFPPPAYRILLELSTMTLPSWVALHITAHSFELRKPLHQVKAVICEGSKKQQLEPCMEQLIGSRWRKEYDRAICCHPVCLTDRLSTS